MLPPKPGTALAQGEVNYDDEEEFYESVDDSCFSGEEHYVAVLSNETDVSFPTGQNIRKPPNVNNGRPVPPARPKPPPRPPDMQNDSESDGGDSEDEELYLDLIKAQGLKGIKSPVLPNKNGLSPTSPERERPIPTPPTPNGPGLSETDGAPVEVLYVSCVEIGAEVEQNAPKPLPKPLPRPSPKPPPRMAKTPSQEKKEFDYLPSDCYKPEMHKNQAKVFLELGRTVGEYMINASQTSDTKMSLSVWLGKGVKHYLIFKRQDRYTLDPSLTRDEHFADLRQLVKYYHNHPLPKSGKYLKAPFAST